MSNALEKSGDFRRSATMREISAEQARQLTRPHCAVVLAENQVKFFDGVPEAVTRGNVKSDDWRLAGKGEKFLMVYAGYPICNQVRSEVLKADPHSEPSDTAKQVGQRLTFCAEIG